MTAPMIKLGESCGQRQAFDGGQMTDFLRAACHILCHAAGRRDVRFDRIDARPLGVPMRSKPAQDLSCRELGVMLEFYSTPAADFLRVIDWRTAFSHWFIVNPAGFVPPDSAEEQG